MNKFITFAALVATIRGQDEETKTDGPSVECLSCKLKDAKSGLTYSYSYCKKEDLCLKDEWNYINAWCPTKWVPGWMLDIDKDCGAVDEPDECLPIFTSENQGTI